MTQQAHVLPEIYRGLILDPFQREAIRHLVDGHSVLVAAPTGVGKTLIADWLVEALLEQGRQVVYTAPIKALSNQKYREFKAKFGEAQVGVITGDIVINAEAPLRIMTTEIFRNMLHEDPIRLEDVGYVIFDEVHYLADEDRGTIWEESLIFMPPAMRFLGLSATIPNASELADWVAGIKGHEVRVVRQYERAVPLAHALFEKSTGPANLARIVQAATQWKERLFAGEGGNRGPNEPPGAGTGPGTSGATVAGVTSSAKAGDSRDRHRHRGREHGPTSNHLDLIHYVQKRHQLPCLYFVFSRRQCEEKARELSMVFNFADREQSKRIAALFDEAISRYDIGKLPMVSSLRQALVRGIAFHHAGLLPVLKEVVEILFQERLVAVLYATETFSVGLNMPVKTVCFDAGTKYSSSGFRTLTTQEYFQMAGRAGRRGIDDRGYVYTLVDLSRFRAEDFPKMDEKAIEPLESRFAISYNSVLNLLTNYPPEEIEGLLARSFANYQRGARTDELGASLARIDEERAALLSSQCASYGKEECPLVVERLRLELRRERFRKKRAKTATRIAAAEDKLAGLRARLAEAKPRSCPRAETRRCKGLHKKLRRLDEVTQLMSQEATRSSEQGYLADFWRRRDILADLGYVDQHGVQGRGRVASQIHVQELLVTELIFEGVFERLTEDEVNALAVSIDYEQRSRGNGWWLRKSPVPYDEQPALAALRRISRVENKHLAQTSTRYATQLAQAAYLWSQGAAFTEVVRQSGTDPGDIVHAFRRAIDLLRQVKGAVRQDEGLVEKLNRCIARLDRDVVAVEL